MITPHGGQLVNRVASSQEKAAVLSRLTQLKALVLSEEKITDLKNIARGAYSPLTGFLKKADFESVAQNMRLTSGLVWPIPIVLDTDENDYNRLKDEQEILLYNKAGQPIALLENIEFYNYDKGFFAQNVFGTTSQEHPGVNNVYKMGNYLAGGNIKLLDNKKEIFPDYNFSPMETRKIFEERGWQSVAAFQTRNVPHRGHEFLQKYALNFTDGLLIQPVIGEKKLADFKDEFILGAYQLLIDNFYPKEKTLLSVLPLKMKYAGPREALLHAIIRQNFGCSHFVVGRDHAGVGNYYGPYDAQKIFNNFKKEEIGIKILKLNNVVWCPSCCEFVFEGACPHSPQSQIAFSGSKIRDSLDKRTYIPPYFMRPEVHFLLAHSRNPLVDNMYQEQKNNAEQGKGFVVWFTGLPCSGKSSIGNLVFEKLKAMGRPTERLDGDIVRQSLTRDLGFSKEDRDENIRRVGFVAKSLSKNSIAVVASFISPYKAQRQGVREQVDNFVEVYTKCPLEVCESRDSKGMYSRARTGEIKNFTGISDPYEEPESPEILLDTSVDGQENIEAAANKVISYLNEHNLI